MCVGSKRAKEVDGYCQSRKLFLLNEIQDGARFEEAGSGAAVLRPYKGKSKMARSGQGPDGIGIYDRDKFRAALMPLELSKMPRPSRLRAKLKTRRYI